MDKLDRLGWVEGICIRAYGLQIGIRANRRGVIKDASGGFPYGWRKSASPQVDRIYSIWMADSGSSARFRRFHLLYNGTMVSARSLVPKDLFGALESDLALYVAGEARDRFFFHSGVVGWRGKAIVIPGESFSGKSTLVAELVRLGATYYSDEYAVLDSQGKVHPFPVPLSLRSAETGQLKKVLSVESGIRIGDKPLPVGLVVLSKFKAEGRWTPKEISGGRVVLDLLANAMSARQRPAKALQTLSRVVTRTPVLKGTRGEAGETARSILNWMNR